MKCGLLYKYEGHAQVQATATEGNAPSVDCIELSSYSVLGRTKYGGIEDGEVVAGPRVQIPHGRGSLLPISCTSGVAEIAGLAFRRFGSLYSRAPIDTTAALSGDDED